MSNFKICKVCRDIFGGDHDTCFKCASDLKLRRLTSFCCETYGIHVKCSMFGFGDLPISFQEIHYKNQSPTGLTFRNTRRVKKNVPNKIRLPTKMYFDLGETAKLRRIYINLKDCRHTFMGVTLKSIARSRNRFYSSGWRRPPRKVYLTTLLDFQSLVLSRFTQTSFVKLMTALCQCPVAVLKVLYTFMYQLDVRDKHICFANHERLLLKRPDMFS